MKKDVEARLEALERTVALTTAIAGMSDAQLLQFTIRGEWLERNTPGRETAEDRANRMAARELVQAHINRVWNEKVKHITAETPGSL